MSVESRSVSGRSPDSFDFASKTPGEFEELAHALVRVDWPAARKLDAPDGGADSLLADADAEGAYERVWQVKRFTGNVSWSQCRKSLDTAVAAWSPRQVTFVFARNLTGNQQMLFDKHLVGRHHGVKVDWWGASDLTERLRREPEGVRIARNHFEVQRFEDLHRAMRAKGALSTAEDALERLTATGEFIDELDPDYAYRVTQAPIGTTGMFPAPPESVRLEIRRGGQHFVIDPIARSPEVLSRQRIKGALRFDETPEGMAGSQRLQAALRDGRSITLDEGVSFSIEGLPTVLQQLWDKSPPTAATVTPVRTPWKARWVVATANGIEILEVDFFVVREDEPRSGRGRLTAQGVVAGLDIELNFVPSSDDDDRGELQISWNYRSTDGPLATEIKVLRFVRALHDPGTVELQDVEEKVRPLRHTNRGSDQSDGYLAALAEYLDSVQAIEKRIGEPLPRPAIAEAEADDVWSVWAASVLLRGSEIELGLESFKATITGRVEEVIAELASGNSMVFQPAVFEMFGKTVHLGELAVPVPVGEVVARTTNPDNPNHIDVTFKPFDPTTRIHLAGERERPDATA